MLRQLLIYLLRFLDLGGEIMAVLGRALRPLKGVVLSGLGAIRGFLNRFAFARALVERIERLAARLFRFGDEAAEAGAGRVAGAADTGATRAVGETAESRGAGAGRARGARGARAGEHASRGKRPTTLGEGALRAADEPGLPTVRDDALKAAQFSEAQIAARAIAEAHDAADAPVPVVLGALMLLKRRYRWIEAFYARPRGPGRFRIVFTATPEHDVDPNYTPGPPLTAEDLRGRLARRESQGLASRWRWLHEHAAGTRTETLL